MIATDLSVRNVGGRLEHDVSPSSVVQLYLNGTNYDIFELLGISSYHNSVGHCLVPEVRYVVHITRQELFLLLSSCVWLPLY
jgi:hypothetical protein